jgi:hypothetical protein
MAHLFPADYRYHSGARCRRVDKRDHFNYHSTHMDAPMLQRRFRTLLCKRRAAQGDGLLSIYLSG